MTPIANKLREALMCRSCEQPFDANDWCSRCEQHASEQLPEKTLDQLLAERPDLRAYRDEVRARLEAGIVRDLTFTMELEANRRAA